MFGVVPKPIWSKLVEPDDQNRILLQTNCVLLEGDGRRIVIETGYGSKWSDKERGFFALERRTIADALADVDVRPDQIDHVIVTHLHFDHAAGLTSPGADGEAVLTFPNAEVIVQRTEWEDARANKSTMTRTYLRNHLDPIADRVRLVDGESDVLPGIRVWPMPGHTWGQQAVRFSDESGGLCFPGDVLPTASHVGSAFNMGYDMLPYQNMLSKTALLERALNEGWRIILDHEPREAVVTVAHDPNRTGRHVLHPARP